MGDDLRPFAVAHAHGAVSGGDIRITIRIADRAVDDDVASGLDPQLAFIVADELDSDGVRGLNVMVVDPHYRRGAFGKHLLAFVIGEAQEALGFDQAPIVPLVFPWREIGVIVGAGVPIGGVATRYYPYDPALLEHGRF